jgi:hypothetical protein
VGCLPAVLGLSSVRGGPGNSEPPKMVGPIDILIRTYFRDFRWLTLSLLSIVNFVDGFRHIVIVMPHSSLERLRGDEIPASARTTVLCCPDYADDYLGQQVTKLNADQFTDASLIAHIDSDSIFLRSCSLPALLRRNGRPVIRVLWRSRRGPNDGWRRCVADFYGEALPFDVLTPPPYVFSRDLYSLLRRNCLMRHGVGLEEWCLSRRADCLSEFGLLAGQAWFHQRDDYCWTTADDETGWPCQAFWSRSPAAAKHRWAIACQLERELARHGFKPIS